MMSSRYNNEDRYIAQPSADEIAAVLGTYLKENGASDDEAGSHSSGEITRTKETGSERDLRRQQRLQEMRRRKKQQERLRRLVVPCAVVLVLCVIFAGIGIRNLVRRQSGRQQVTQNETVGGETEADQSALGGIALDEQASDQKASDQKASDEQTSDEKVLDKKASNKGILYDGSLNIAGCDPGGTTAASINEEITQIAALFVRTLGGRGNEPPLSAVADETTVLPDQAVLSENSIFIDVAAGRIMGQRDAGVRISPASMTKILTVLVAAEHITDPDDIFEITQDITDYSYVNKCSNAGFDVGEKVTVRDLFYGTVLPSGADAALGLAIYVAGSQEAFVELMNEKIDALGLSRTSHFTNCVGLYDENHYSTVYDIAVMLKAACDNSFCREVLNAHTYTTSATEQHPDGIILSNWFLRRIEDKDTNGEVLCAKTGFVEQSGSCAASLSVGNDGKEYICVTAHANSPWLCIYDHVALCQQFMSGEAPPPAGDV